MRETRIEWPWVVFAVSPQKAITARFENYAAAQLVAQTLRLPFPMVFMVMDGPEPEIVRVQE